MEKFKKLVEQHFDLNINKRSRLFKYVFARACYYELCQRHTDNSLANISESVDRTHATVINAIKGLPYMLKSNHYFARKYNELQIKKDKLLGINKEQMDLNTLVNNYNILLFENDSLKKNLDDLVKKNRNLLTDCKEMKRIIYIMADTD
jgi:hypothetical protein